MEYWIGFNRLMTGNSYGLSKNTVILLIPYSEVSILNTSASEYGTCYIYFYLLVYLTMLINYACLGRQ